MGTALAVLPTEDRIHRGRLTSRLFGTPRIVPTPLAAVCALPHIGGSFREVGSFVLERHPPLRLRSGGRADGELRSTPTLTAQLLNTARWTCGQAPTQPAHMPRVPTALSKKNRLRHSCCNPLILLAEWTTAAIGSQAVPQSAKTSYAASTYVISVVSCGTIGCHEIRVESGDQDGGRSVWRRRRGESLPGRQQAYP